MLLLTLPSVSHMKMFPEYGLRSVLLPERFTVYAAYDGLPLRRRLYRSLRNASSLLYLIEKQSFYADIIFSADFACFYR